MRESMLKVFTGGQSRRHPQPSTEETKFQTPGRLVRVLHKPHCLYSLGTASHGYHLGKIFYQSREGFSM